MSGHRSRRTCSTTFSKAVRVATPCSWSVLVMTATLNSTRSWATGRRGMGDDYLTVRAIDIDGDIRFIDFAGGPGNDRISAYGFRDVEDSTLNGGDGNDTLVAYAGRVFSFSSADSEMGTAIGFDFGDNNFTFSTINDGIRFNTVDLPEDGVSELDNISWAVGGDEWVLALDQDGDGLISKLNEIDFTIENPGATRAIDALGVYDLDPNLPSSPQNGFIDTNDEAFDRFVLWQDRNNDGMGTPDELMTLAEAGVTSISLGTTGAAYGEGDVIVDGVGSFSLAGGDRLLTSFRFRGVAGGNPADGKTFRITYFWPGTATTPWWQGRTRMFRATRSLAEREKTLCEWFR